MQVSYRIRSAAFLGLFCVLNGVHGQDVSDQEILSLVQRLKSSQQTIVRENAVLVLTGLGPRAKLAVPALIEALKDPSDEMRSYAASALGKIGPQAKDGVTGLIECLRDSSSSVRSRAAFSLGEIGFDARAAIPALLASLQAGNSIERSSYIYALGSMAPESRASIPILISLLKDPDPAISTSAAESLGKFGDEAGSAVPLLIELLRSPDNQRRRVACDALQKMGSTAKLAIPALTQAVSDNDQLVSRSAAAALDNIATALYDAKASDAIPSLSAAYELLNGSLDGHVREHAPAVKRSLEYLQSLWSERLWQTIQYHSYIAVVSFGYLCLLVLCIVLLLCQPLALLHINRKLTFDAKVSVGGKALELTLPIRYLLLVGFFQYRHRVLDAWILKHSEFARRAFSEKATVAEREVYVPIPVTVQNRNIVELDSNELRRVFDRNFCLVLISGEGGAGKTSLACQIGKRALSSVRSENLFPHLAIPLLNDQELDDKSDDSFFVAIQDQLRGSINETELPDVNLIRELLKERRLLIIVDGLSEMSELSKERVEVNLSRLPTNAAILTSRSDETLKGLSKTTIRPLRISGERLAGFIDGYLVLAGKRELFDDREYFDFCLSLSSMVGDRDLTPLLVKLYANQIIRTKQSTGDENLPSNVPELMLSYLNNLNRNATDLDPDDRLVQEALKTIAWECLKTTFRPASADKMRVLTALGGEGVASNLIKHLEHKLKVIQTSGVGRDRIRFSLDPLAEYLAAMFVVDTFGDQRKPWDELLDEIARTDGSPGSIKGFVVALNDCCLTAAPGSLPNTVLSKLAATLASRAPMSEQSALAISEELKAEEFPTRELETSTPDDEYSKALPLTNEPAITGNFTLIPGLLFGVIAVFAIHDALTEVISHFVSSNPGSFVRIDYAMRLLVFLLVIVRSYFGSVLFFDYARRLDPKDRFAVPSLIFGLVQFLLFFVWAMLISPERNYTRAFPLFLLAILGYDALWFLWPGKRVRVSRVHAFISLVVLIVTVFTYQVSNLFDFSLLQRDLLSFLPTIVFMVVDLSAYARRIPFREPVGLFSL